MNFKLHHCFCVAQDVLLKQISHKLQAGDGGEKINGPQKLFWFSPLQICVKCVFRESRKGKTRKTFIPTILDVQSPPLTIPEVFCCDQRSLELSAIRADFFSFQSRDDTWSGPKCELEDVSSDRQTAWSSLSKFHSWKVGPLCELEDASWVRQIHWSSLNKCHSWKAGPQCEIGDEFWGHWISWISWHKSHSWMFFGLCPQFEALERPSRVGVVSNWWLQKF